MNLITMMPFGLDMNLGRAYNEAMALLPPDGWAIFLDHDAIWTTREWYRQIREAIDFKPDAGMFTAVTNRIFQPWQRAGDPDNHDMAAHRAFGAERLKRRTLLDVTNTSGIGGVVMALSRSAWESVGGFADGLLCVDHNMHYALMKSGRRVYVIESLYVYHWRRANGDALPREVPRTASCPFDRDRRSWDANPRARVRLP